MTSMHLLLTFTENKNWQQFQSTMTSTKTRY